MRVQTPKTMRRLAPVALICLAIILLNFLIQIKSNKSYQGMSVDSGVFAYCGQQILGGHLLYRDCFDNKGPAVYYLDAIAILLTRPTPGGIWLFQMLWAAVTLVSFFLIIRLIWGSWTAGLATLVFMGTALDPAYYSNGNITESYVLLPLALLIGAAFGYLSSGRRRYLAGIGLLAAFAFLLKPTYISLSFSIILVVFLTDFTIRGFRATAGQIGLLAAGGAAPLILVAIYWWIRGGLSDLIFAVFTHNTQYVQEGFTWWGAKQSFLKFLLTQPMALVFGLALAAGAVFLADNWRPVWNALRKPETPPQDRQNAAIKTISMDNARRLLVLALFISIPFEVFFVTISGRDFGHYYLLPIPALAASSAYLFSIVVRSLPESFKGNSLIAWAAAAAIIVFAIPWAFEVIDKERPHRADLADYFKNPDITTYQLSNLEAYIRDHSQPDQSVLVWSTHPSINLVTGRRSPTRYVYALHILTPTPTGSTGFPELIGSLSKDPPALIVAQKISSVGLPDFWSADASLCPNCTPQARQGLLALKIYINSHYQFARQIYDWYIYRWTG